MALRSLRDLSAKVFDAKKRRGASILVGSRASSGIEASDPDPNPAPRPFRHDLRALPGLRHSFRAHNLCYTVLKLCMFTAIYVSNSCSFEIKVIFQDSKA